MLDNMELKVGQEVFIVGRCRALLGLELPEHSHGDNPIDACVEMILKLKKRGVI